MMAGVRALAELVRLPSALTVPGDCLTGAAAAGAPRTGRRLLLPVSSACLYWAGMALNDWADRELDARERPERPIPSGRVANGAALGVAAGLTASGVGLAAAAAGRAAVPPAAALAAAIWCYDLVAKDGPAGPAVMALCRGLDVLLGAVGGDVRAARPAVLTIGAHTWAVTVLSRGEVHGGRPLSVAAAGAVTAVVGGLGGRSLVTQWRRGGGSPAAAAVSAAALAAYLGTVAPALLIAARDSSAARVRAATTAGIHGMVPLQAALAARQGAFRTGAALLLTLPLLRRSSRRVSPT
jgi:4-hydroxybenzoate polyprenyltransferase